MSDPTVIYYRWTYSPTTGDVTLAHNHEGHPTDVRFHTDMAEERSEHDLLFGFAHRASEGKWAITDDDSRPSDDPNLLHEVTHAITQDEKQRRLSQKLSYDEGSEEKWAWIEGLPVEKWGDSEIGDGGYGEYAEGPSYSPRPGFDSDGVKSHFVTLVDMAMKDPKLAPAAEQYSGVGYSRLNYSNVAAFLNESQRKWAIGTSGEFNANDYGEGEYERGLQMGSHGPTTTKEDVEAAIGEKVIMPDSNIYGVGQGDRNKGADYKPWDDDDDLWDDEDDDPPQTFG